MSSDYWNRKRHRANPTDPYDGLTAKQRGFIEAPGRIKSALVGRRGAKTDMAGRAAVRLLLNDPGELALLISGTSGRAEVWRRLQRAVKLDHLPIKLDNNRQVATGPDASTFEVHGMETIRDVENRRGIAPKLVIVDECGVHRPKYLEYLAEEVLDPMLMDNRESEHWYLGSPGRVATGYWHGITTGKIKGYRRFHWTAEDNPHVDYEHYVYDSEEGILARRGWTEQHPAFIREVLGRWSVSDTDRVLMFDPERNVVDKLPPLYPGDRWLYIMAADFGVLDACAIAVIAYPMRYGQDAYVVDTWSARGMGTPEMTKVMRRFVDQYHPEVLVGDTGGIGKAYWREWNKRKRGIEMKPAQKVDKAAALEVVSELLQIAHTTTDLGLLRTRRGLMSLADNTEFHEQAISVVWDDDRKDIAEGQDDDVLMSVVYAARELPTFENQKAPPDPDPYSAEARSAVDKNAALAAAFGKARR